MYLVDGQAGLKMLELGKGNVVEKLDEGLAGDVSLVTGKFFDSNKDGGSGNGKDIEDVYA